MGRPKALIRPSADGPTLVERAVDVLLSGGCAGATVVVGAAADEVADDLGELRAQHARRFADVDIIRSEDWAEGMGASLRAGLDGLAGRPEVDAVLVMLVDLPDVGADVVLRLLASTDSAARAELRRAAYGGVPGHPTLIGRDHWDGVAALARGDRGARDYLSTHPHVVVECGDLASGRDVDTPEDL
jgi:CTP:molybdopterin cytidylyltransferase MocA